MVQLIFRKHTPSPYLSPGRIRSLLVKRYERRRTPEKLGSSHLPFQGHSRSSELTRIDGVPMTFVRLRSNRGSILYRLQDTAIYWPKITNFPTTAFNASAKEVSSWNFVTLDGLRKPQ